MTQLNDGPVFLNCRRILNYKVGYEGPLIQLRHSKGKRTRL